jgi:hypothetical protein
MPWQLLLPELELAAELLPELELAAELLGDELPQPARPSASAIRAASSADRDLFIGIDTSPLG